MRLRHLLFIVIIMSTSVHADSGRGRMADGRAYRTDAEGNQIVDYIAELELEVAHLKQRVTGLEIEVEQRDQAIARVKSGGSLDAQTLKEKDLLTGKVKTTGSKSGAGEDIQTLQARLAALQSQADACTSEQQAQQKTISSLQQQNAKLSRQDSDRDSVDTGAFQALEVKKNVEQARLKEKIASLESVLTQKEEELSEKAEEIRSLDVRLQKAELELKERESAPETPPYARVVQQQRSIPSSSTGGRDSALQAFKGSIKKDMVKIQRMIDERNRLFIIYRQRNGGKLSFSPKKAVSSNGRSLPQITRLLDSAQSTSEVSALQRDVREIGTFIKNDLAFIKRMSKIS